MGKRIAAVLCAVLALAGLVSCDAQSADTPAVSGAVTSEPAETQVEGTSAPEDAWAEEADGETGGTSLDNATLAAMLLKEMEDSYDYCTVTGDADGITVSIAVDGFSAGINALDMDNPDDAAYWNGLMGEFESMSATVQEIIDAAGNEGDSFLNVLNDVNPERILVMVVNGQCVYDCMEQA